MAETSATIALWGQQTFGSLSSPMAALERAALEMDELREAIARPETPPKEMAMEAADVVILLHRLCGELGYDLNALVDEKMRLNRDRQWTVAGDGTGQHQE